MFLLAADICSKSDFLPDLYKNLHSAAPQCEVQIDSFGSITTLILNIIGIALFLAGFLAVVFIVIGGIQYTTSGGDEKKVAKAKSTIINAIIGVVLASMAYTIVTFITTKIAG